MNFATQFLEEVQQVTRRLDAQAVERVVDELMTAIDYMKSPTDSKVISDDLLSTTHATGLGIQIDGQASQMESRRTAIRQRASHLLVRCRRRLIPHQLRAVVLILISQWKNFDLIDQMLSAAVIIAGTMLGITLMLVERGQRLFTNKTPLGRLPKSC